MAIKIVITVQVSLTAEQLAADVTSRTQSPRWAIDTATNVPGMSVPYTMPYTLSGTPTVAGTYSIGLGYRDAGKVYVTDYMDLIVEDPFVAPPEPEDEPAVPEAQWTRTEPHPDAAKLLRHMGMTATPKALAQADEHLATVTVFVYGYTRGRGFTEAEAGAPVPAWDLRHVILTAAARSMSNPTQLRQYTVGDYNESPAALSSWSLVETAVLHRYRKRAA